MDAMFENYGDGVESWSSTRKHAHPIQQFGVPFIFDNLIIVKADVRPLLQCLTLRRLLVWVIET